MSDLLNDELAVLNVGIGEFADSVLGQGKPVVQVDWRPSGDGDAAEAGDHGLHRLEETDRILPRQVGS